LLPSPLQRYRASPGRHVVYDDIALTSTGAAGPDHNYAAVLGPRSPAEVLELADAFFGDEIYAVLVEVESASAMVTALQALDWQLDEEEPALVLAPLPPLDHVPSPPAGLVIRMVTTQAEFETFSVIAQPGNRWVPALDAALDPAVALFVGYVDSVPAATARLGIYDSVGDINSVITAPAYRRRGFGTALTWAAVAEGARRGCTAMTLTATKMGYPVYERMGFEPVCTYRTYVPPVPATTRHSND
jgi:ribosomal protein S18 acetylase RimI-like enzyme